MAQRSQHNKRDDDIKKQLKDQVTKELAFRDLNEKFRQSMTELYDQVGEGNLPVGFRCECGSLICWESVRIPIKEYTSVRKKHPNGFLVLPGHDVLVLERVVDKTPLYWVVTKKKASEIAEYLDFPLQ